MINYVCILTWDNEISATIYNVLMAVKFVSRDYFKISITERLKICQQIRMLYLDSDILSQAMSCLFTIIPILNSKNCK